MTPPTTSHTTQLSASTTASPNSLSTSPVVSSSTPSPTGAAEKTLENLLEKVLSNSSGLNVIESLSSISSSIDSAKFTEKEVQLMLSILGNFTNNATQSKQRFDPHTIKQTVSIATQLNEHIFTMDRQLSLLQSLENVFSSMKATNETFNSTTSNIIFSCTNFNPKGLNVNSHLHLSSGATVSLSTDNINKPSGSPINILSMIYRPKTTGENVPFGSSNDHNYFLTSPIWTIAAIVNNKSDHSLSVNMNFTCNNKPCDETAQCVFLNFASNEWLSEGCSTTVINGSTTCACNHLTSFSVLMADFVPQDQQTDVILDIITKTLLPVSIASLLNCIAIQILLIVQASSSVALYRHICILHIAVFLMISNVSFLASSLFNITAYSFLCKMLTFVTHFSLLAFFSWTLVQSLFLVCRLIFIFHHITKKEFLLLSVILGYGCPGSIAVSTFLVYYPNKYLRTNVCWLDNRYGAHLFFNIPAMIIMCGNIIILLIVIKKVLRPSISEGDSQDDEVVKKLMRTVLFCTPQFGLTWAIGIPMYVYPQVVFLHYLFALLNPLQGFFVLLFGCLLDKKVKDTLKEIFQIKSWNPFNRGSYSP